MPDDLLTGQEHQFEERFLSGHTGRMFVVLTLGLTTVRIGRRALPPLLPTLTDDLGITLLRLVWPYQSRRWFFGLMQYPSGRIGDRLTRKTALVASLGTGIIGLGILAATPSYEILLLGAAVVGTGEGLADAFRR
jgi:MFS family permease